MQEILSILKTLAESNTINFIIMLVILGLIVRKIHLNESFQKATDKIQNNIETSEKTKQNSQDNLAQSQKKMEELPKELATLEKTSESKIKSFEDTIKITTQKTITNINQSIQKTMAIEEKKLSNHIKERTSHESIDLAKNKIIDILKKNPNLHNQFIQQSLDELDKVKL